MNTKDHKIEITESGFAFCPVCKGGEIELEESCASRVKRLSDRNTPAVLTDRQALLIIENTNKRIYAELAEVRDEKADLGMKLCYTRDSIATLQADKVMLYERMVSAQECHADSIRKLRNAEHLLAAKTLETDGLRKALEEMTFLATNEGWNTTLFMEPFGAAVRSARAVLSAAPK